jgi:hypothetical protein
MREGTEGGWDGVVGPETTLGNLTLLAADALAASGKVATRAAAILFASQGGAAVFASAALLTAPAASSTAAPSPADSTMEAAAIALAVAEVPNLRE